MNCYVDKIKLQTQTTINASTHMHCSYHELFQRRDTEKEKLTFWYGCQKKYVRLELLLSGLSNFFFFLLKVLLGSGDKAFVSGRRGAGAINSLQVNI